MSLVHTRFLLPLLFAVLCVVAVGASAGPVQPGARDTDIGIVHPEDPGPDVSEPGDDPNDPWTSECWDLDIKCLEGSTHGEAAIMVTVFNGAQVVGQPFYLNPGEPMPEPLHCEFTRVEISHVGAPGSSAGWGVTWLATGP